MSARTILKHLYEEGRMTEAQYQKIDRNLKERPHGEWIVLPRGSFECPNCQGSSKVKYMFCHWCGADMRPKEGEAK